MDSWRSLARLPPLLFGRVSRVVFGIGTLGVLWYVGADDVGSVGALLLGFLGLSFLVGGVLANPGCEITALTNIFLPRDKRMHFL